MCGIIGVFNYEQATVRFRKAMELIRHRGEDAFGWTDGKQVRTSANYAAFLDTLKSRNNILGHSLHAIVGHCPQPLKGRGILVANCEIYNWKALASKYAIEAENDAGLLLALFDRIEKLEPKAILAILKELNGDYALAYWRDDQVIFARDLIGIKPLWYSRQDGLAFASERKALKNAGYDDIREFSPRRLGIYSLKDDRLRLISRSFFTKPKPSAKSEAELADDVSLLLHEAIKRRLPDPHIKVAILFSGGLDSTLIAKACQDLGVDFTCYTAIIDNPAGKPPHDLVAAKKAAKRYGFTHRIIKATEADIPRLAKKVIDEIEEPHAIKVAVGMPFYLASEAAKHDGCRVVLSGLGAEELFAGYQRHKEAADVNDECLSGLRMLYERDLYRDDVITMRQGIELRVPFLDRPLIKLALRIPGEMKIKDGKEKHILRMAGKIMGLHEEDYSRPKKAAQYGSKFDQALQKVARRQGMNRSQYLKTLTTEHSQRIGILCSGGKDSWFAAQIMGRQNYQLSCLLTIRSQNPESYMFHTASLDMVRLQSEASGIPILEHETKGEKEAELEDLKALLKKAKEEYRIAGITTGALFSQYQRERIERIADKVGLKVFSPLWHLDQEAEMRELLKEGFSFIMTHIAAEGLDAEWLGRIITENDVDRLAKLRDSIGINVAGEGGEFESLVLDCPLFQKRIVIEGFNVEKEAEHTARLIIERASLQEK